MPVSCQFLASFSFLTKCNSSHLETLLGFAWKCLNTPNLILSGQQQSLQLCLHFSRLPPLTEVALRRNLANNSFVLIAGSFLIQFTKLVIGLSKSVMGAAIKNTGHPGRRFLAASPLDFAAPPLYLRSKNNLNRQATQASQNLEHSSKIYKG